MKKLVLLLMVMAFVFKVQAEPLDNKLASLYINNQIDQAVSFCESQLKTAVNKKYYLLNLALLYEDKGDIFKAIDILQSHRDNFWDRDIAFNLGRLYCLAPRPHDAVSLFEDYTNIYPGDSKAHFYLGLSYEDLGNTRKALASYEKALEYDPYFILPLIRIAEIYFGGGNYRQAVKYFQMVKRFDPSIKLSYRRLAFAFFYENDYLSSFKEASQYINMGESDEEMKFVLNRSRKELGQDFFQREREKKQKVRKAKLLEVNHFAAGTGIPDVKVCIGRDLKKFYLKPTEKFFLYSDGKPVYELSKARIYELKMLSADLVKITEIDNESISGELPLPFSLEPETKRGLLGVFGLRQGQGTYWEQKIDNFFRGVFEVKVINNKLCLLNILNIEEYLYGVVPSEVSPDWPKAALQAQAIAARTRAVRSLGAHQSQGFDFCNTVHCQVYLGASREKPSTTQAVDSTRGIVLTQDGEPIQIFYSSNCGGHTHGYKNHEGVQDYNQGLEVNFPLCPWDLYKWITQVPDSFCRLEGNLKSRYRWQRMYTVSMLRNLIGQNNSSLEGLSLIRVLGRGSSGHTEALKVISAQGDLRLDSEFQIRQILDNLRSSLFRIEVKYGQDKKPEYFIFWGGGFGHGMGLCQYGAKGMADKGYSYRQILVHYFPESDLNRDY